jgi:hypothetical protein
LAKWLVIRVETKAVFTTLKDRKKELGKGLLGNMCRDLKIRAEEL